MTFSTNKLQFKFQIADLPADTFIIRQFSGEAALSSSYYFLIDCISNHMLDTTTLIAQTAKLIISDERSPNYWHGIIANCQFQTNNHETYAYQFRLVSLLHPLFLQSSAQVFVNQSPLEITQQILKNFPLINLQWLLQSNYAKLSFRMQLNETDAVFLNEMFSQLGWIYYFLQTSNFPILQIADHINALPNFPDKNLFFYPESGLVSTQPQVLSFREHTQLLPKQVRLNQVNLQTPNLDLTVNSVNKNKITGDGIFDYFNWAYTTLEEGKKLAQLTLEAFAAQRQYWSMTTDCRYLQLGQRFTLNNHYQYQGDYRVIAMKISGQQLAFWGINNSAPNYFASCKVISANQSLRIFPNKKNNFNHILPAKIEAINNDLSRPYLDEQGRYHIRFPFDHSEHRTGQASCPIQMLQTHAGKITEGQLATGLHFPLRAHTQVAVGFIQGDLQRPIILGAIHNSENISPATAENATENCLRTSSGNELTLDDQLFSPKITLANKNHLNKIILDATPNHHQLQMISKQGEINIYAKKTLHLETEGSAIYETKQNHIINVKQKHKLLTKQQGITYEANANIQLTAQGHLQISTAQNFDVQTQQQMQVIAQQQLSQQSFTGLQIQTFQGNINMQVNKNAIFHSAGSALTIGQLSNNLRMTMEGNFYLTGLNINFAAAEINIFGAPIT